MRDFINYILTFIGSTSLTDEEFDSLVDIEDTFGNNIVTFNAIKMLLIERDEVTEATDRLKFYFMAKGVLEVPDEDTPAKSNIFVGSALGGRFFR